MVKSTASRRIQVSSTTVPAGKSAMLPLPHSASYERFKKLHDDNASRGSGSPRSVHVKSPSSISSESRSTRFQDSVDSRHFALNDDKLNSANFISSPISDKSSPSPVKGVFSIHSSRDASKTRGALKRTGTAEFGPTSYIYIRVRGETNYWDVVAPMVARAKSKEFLKEFLVTPQVSARSARFSSPSSPQDLLRPVSDAVVAERIRAANKEFEVRDVSEFVMADIFHSLMNPWDTGLQLIDAVMTEASGLRISDGLVSGNPLYGVYFSELLETRLSDKFVIELHYALGNVPPEDYEQPAEYVSTVRKKKIPIHWKYNERTILAQKRNYYLEREAFFKAIQIIGISCKGSLYKEFDKM